MKRTIAVIGCGYWGKNLVRNFHELGCLHSVCHVDQATRDEMHGRFGVPAVASPDEVFADPDINAVVLASPATLHYGQAKQALLAGKDVFVEKPLAMRVDEGQELVRVARQRKRILMVGHLLEYHPAVLELKRLILAGEMGNIQYIHSSRLNWGKLRVEENIWRKSGHLIAARWCRAIAVNCLYRYPKAVWILY